MKAISKEQIDALQRYAHDIGGMIWSGQPPEALIWVNIADLRAMYDNAQDVGSEAIMRFGENLEIDNHNCVMGEETGRLVAKFSHEAEARAFVSAYNNKTAPQPDRVAELEAKLKEYEADAKRWQTCVELNQFPKFTNHRLDEDASYTPDWSMVVNNKMVIADSAEEAIDQAMKG